MLELAQRADRPGASAGYQNVQIILDPKTIDLDKVVSDVLKINGLVTEKTPQAKLKSITIDNRFAAVDIVTPGNHATTGTTIRLYKIGEIWKIKDMLF